MINVNQRTPGTPEPLQRPILLGTPGTPIPQGTPSGTPIRMIMSEGEIHPMSPALTPPPAQGDDHTAQGYDPVAAKLEFGGGNKKRNSRRKKK